MDSLFVAAPALGCVLMMVPLMWFMSRGMKQNDQPSSNQSSSLGAERGTEVAELQAEVDRLRAEVRARGPEAAPERR